MLELNKRFNCKSVNSQSRYRSQLHRSFRWGFVQTNLQQYSEILQGMTSNLGLKIEFWYHKQYPYQFITLVFLFKVHRVEYLPEKEQDGEIDMIYKDWSIERGCDSHCDPEKSNFCVEMGARTKVLYCTSCCEGNLCNVDNKASPFNVPINILLINQIFFIFVLYGIIR